jgi:hypothetical protein
MSENLNQELAQESLSLLLMKLRDEFNELQSCCSFMCDSFTAMSFRKAEIGAYTPGGISLFSFWINSKLESISDQLEEAHKTSKIEVETKKSGSNVKLSPPSRP